MKLISFLFTSSSSSVRLPWVLTRFTHSFIDSKTSSFNLSSSKLKRFWKQTSVQSNQDGHQIFLDHRPLKTPKGSILMIPKSKLLAANLIANEWQTQPTYFKYGSFPLTSLFVRAQDDFVNQCNRKETIEKLISFLHTDTICYHQSFPDSLVQLQKQHWDPILTWCQSTFQIQLNITHDLFNLNQPCITIQTLQQLISTFSPLELACFESCTLATKSYLISLTLLHGFLSSKSAVNAARIELTSQVLKWGEIEEAHGLDLEHMSRQVSACSIALL